MSQSVKNKIKSLSIFFPCYNDAGTVGSLVVSAYDVAKSLTNDFEVIVIDDGSNDNSREILDSLLILYNDLKIVLHKTNQGYGSVLKSGFENSSKDLIFYTDGDGQYDVYELKKLFNIMQEDIDVVNGYKIERNDPMHRKIIGKIYLFIMRILFRFKTRDVDCDFRLIRASAMNNIDLKHKSGVVCLELVKKLEKSGAKIIDVPVNHYFRTYGKSQIFNFKKLIVIACNIFILFFDLIKIPNVHNNGIDGKRNPSLLKYNSELDV